MQWTILLTIAAFLCAFELAMAQADGYKCSYDVRTIFFIRVFLRVSVFCFCVLTNVPPAGDWQDIVTLVQLGQRHNSES